MAAQRPLPPVPDILILKSTQHLLRYTALEQPPHRGQEQETHEPSFAFPGVPSVSPHYCLVWGWPVIEVSLTKATRLLQVGRPSLLIPSSEECVDA